MDAADRIEEAVDRIGGLLETAIGTAVLSREEIRAYVGSESAVVLAWTARADESPELRRMGGNSWTDEAAVGETGMGGETDEADGTGRAQAGDDATADGTITDEPIVGVSIAREFADPAALTEHPYLHAAPDELLARIDLTEAAFPVGSVLVTGIAEAYRGQGLGREISFAAVDALAARGATPILQLEWDRPDSPGVDQLEKAGFAPAARFEEHFPPEWTCGACETSRDGGRCTCDVVAFLL